MNPTHGADGGGVTLGTMDDNENRPPLDASTVNEARALALAELGGWRPGHLELAAGVRLRPGRCLECGASGFVLSVVFSGEHYGAIVICGACVSRLGAELAAELADPRFAWPLDEPAIVLLVEERRERERLAKLQASDATKSPETWQSYRSAFAAGDPFPLDFVDPDDHAATLAARLRAQGAHVVLLVGGRIMDVRAGRVCR